MARVAIFLCFLCVTGALQHGPVQAAPRAELWERWLAHDPSSTAHVDHSPWERFLKRYVLPGQDGVNRVAYGKVTDADGQALESYVADLSGVPVGALRRAEQFAFWVNLYNALTVAVILDHYPVETILDIDISPGWFANGPWGRKLIEVEGERLSLDDIEHRILRPIWRDPRIHFALNCASVGCPNLMRAAFTAEDADAMLDGAARDYLNHPRGARVHEGKLYLSTIFIWYGDDFGDEAEIVAYVRRYANPELTAALGGVRTFSDGGYDWALNDAGINRSAGPGP